MDSTGALVYFGDPILRPPISSGPDLLPQFRYTTDHSRSTPGALMIEMDGWGTMPDPLWFATQILYPVAEGCILSTVAHIHIETIDGQEVLPPGGSIVPMPTCWGRRDTIEDEA